MTRDSLMNTGSSSSAESRVTSHESRITLAHWNPDPFPIGGRKRGVVTRIRMPGDANARIIREHSLEPHAHLGRPVGHDHLARMQRIADADAAAVVERDPRSSTGHVEQRVLDGPVGNGIA